MTACIVEWLEAEAALWDEESAPIDAENLRKAAQEIKRLRNERAKVLGHYRSLADTLEANALKDAGDPSNRLVLMVVRMLRDVTDCIGRAA